jgi:hypothetical protein
MSIFNILCEFPFEIQEIILNYIPINILININNIELELIIENYIENYIKNNLLSDLANIGVLLAIPKYYNMLTERLEELSLSYARNFMEKVNKFSVGTAINMFNYYHTPITTISLKIEFTFKEGKPYRGTNSMTANKEYHTYTLTNNGCSNNTCASYICNKLKCIKYDELSLSKEIYNILLNKITYNDKKTNIASIKFIKTFYPTGINENYIEEILY